MELTAVLAAASLLAMIGVSALAGTRADSDRAACHNNLRQLGRAVQMWGSDHRERAPWWTPMTEGGTFPASGSKAGNAWVEWATFTNELRSPVVLTCPADIGVRVAATFDSSPTGFFNTSLRSAALSYVLGLHTFSEYPNSIISADRNLRSFGPVSCSAGIGNADGLSYPLAGGLWTNAVHGVWGHVLLTDGHVEMMTSTRLGNLLITDPYNGASEHILRAR